MFLEKIVRNWYLVHKYENELLQVEFKTKSHNKTDFKSATISCDLERLEQIKLLIMLMRLLFLLLILIIDLVM